MIVGEYPTVDMLKDLLGRLGRIGRRKTKEYEIDQMWETEQQNNREQHGVR